MNPVTVTIPNASVPIGKTHVKKTPTKERELSEDTIQTIIRGKDAEFKESDHPRGQPGNPGQFASSSGGGSSEESDKIDYWLNKPIKTRADYDDLVKFRKSILPPPGPEDWKKKPTDPLYKKIREAQNYLQEQEANDPEMKEYERKEAEASALQKKLVESTSEPSKMQLSALKKYLSPEFEHINRYLRMRNTPDSMSDFTKKYKGAADKIISWLDKTSLPQDVTVFKGIGAYEAEQLIPKLKPGFEMVRDDFMSTSLEEDISKRFNERGAGLMFEIDAPKGSKGAIVDQFKNLTNEKEILFQVGSKLRFESYDPEKRRVKFKLISPELAEKTAEDAEFKEAEHPRKFDGKFGSGGGKRTSEQLMHDAAWSGLHDYLDAAVEDMPKLRTAVDRLSDDPKSLARVQGYANLVTQNIRGMERGRSNASSSKWADDRALHQVGEAGREMSRAAESGDHGEIRSAASRFNAALSLLVNERQHAKPAEDAKSVVLKAAGLIIRTPDGLALFVKRATGQDHEGEWSFPGGAIENAETAELAAIRETREETGWIVPEDAKLEKVDNRTSPEGVEFTTFEIKTNNPFIPELDDENQGWAWAPLHDPPQPVHPGVNRTLGGMAGDEIPGKKAANQATPGELRSVIKFPPPEAPDATRAINVEFANGGAGKVLKKAPAAERFEERGGITEKDKRGPLGHDSKNYTGFVERIHGERYSPRKGDIETSWWGACVKDPSGHEIDSYWRSWENGFLTKAQAQAKVDQTLARLNTKTAKDKKTVDFQRKTDTNGNSLSFSTMISGGRKL